MDGPKGARTYYESPTNCPFVNKTHTNSSVDFWAPVRICTNQYVFINIIQKRSFICNKKVYNSTNCTYVSPFSYQISTCDSKPLKYSNNLAVYNLIK